MGNKSIQNQQKIINQLGWNKLHLVSKDNLIKQYQQNIQYKKYITLKQFQCLIPQEQNQQNKYSQLDFTIGQYQSTITITKTFQTQQDIQAYSSNILNLQKLLNLTLFNTSVFDGLQISKNQQIHELTMRIDIPDFKIIDQDFYKNTIDKKIQLLYFIANILSKVDNIYIKPQYIAMGSNGYHLLNFQVKGSKRNISQSKSTINFSAQTIFVGFIKWMFMQHNFEICLQLQDIPVGMPICLQQICKLMGDMNKKIKVHQIQPQIKMMKQKLAFLLGKTDSFYACYFFKKTQKYQMKNQWIYFKMKHQVFFYNIRDLHSHQGKLIRKKRKIVVDQISLTFDPEQLQLLFVNQNSKHIVKACQFQFQTCSSISDIQIKYKLPVKFKKPLINRNRNGQIFILQYYLYRFNPISNKLIQQTKKINQYIFLTSMKDGGYLIIKNSIDIFRNGIRVFYKGLDIVVSITGNQQILSQISSIRIDLKQIIFCNQIYRGVFLMMAAKNLWIIDMNFQCFFSYAGIQQIKKLAAISRDLKQNKKSDYVFQIYNQQFRVDFSKQNNGCNAITYDNYLHIIGTVDGLPYYFKYSFIHRIGALKLQGYQPLFYIFVNNINHRNISTSNIYFTKYNQIKITGWRQPPRNWHVSDFKDFLLTCLNVITYNNYQKISDKIIFTHQKQLETYPLLNQKIQAAFKQSKMIEKKIQIQKNMLSLKNYLEKQISQIVFSTTSDKYILSFQYNTPRFSLLNIETQKLKKIVIIPQQTAIQQFTFHQTDQTVWAQQISTLYIFTINHQFYQVKLNLTNYSQQKLLLQDYQYLPNNLSLSTFAYVDGRNLYSFGGIKRQQQGKLSYCTKIYKFNWKTLSWDAIGDLPQKRVKPYITTSVCKKFIYIFGGNPQLQYPYNKIIKYSIQQNQCIVQIDYSSPNIMNYLTTKLPLKIFHINSLLRLFLIWYVQQNDYVFRYISFIAPGFDIQIRAKGIFNQNGLCRQSITMELNNIHILRTYGKYTKLSAQKFQNILAKNQTVYAI